MVLCRSSSAGTAAAASSAICRMRDATAMCSAARLSSRLAMYSALARRCRRCCRDSFAGPLGAAGTSAPPSASFSCSGTGAAATATACGAPGALGCPSSCAVLAGAHCVRALGRGAGTATAARACTRGVPPLPATPRPVGVPRERPDSDRRMSSAPAPSTCGLLDDVRRGTEGGPGGAGGARGFDAVACDDGVAVGGGGGGGAGRDGVSTGGETRERYSCLTYTCTGTPRPCWPAVSPGGASAAAACRGGGGGGVAVAACAFTRSRNGTRRAGPLAICRTWRSCAFASATRCAARCRCCRNTARRARAALVACSRAVGGSDATAGVVLRRACGWDWDCRPSCRRLDRDGPRGGADTLCLCDGWRRRARPPRVEPPLWPPPRPVACWSWCWC